MKTLHLTNSWHPKSGGIRTFYMALLAAANTRGHEMRIVVPAESSRVEPVGAHGLIYHVESPPAPRSPSYRVLYPHRMLLPGSPVHAILRNEKPDLVEVCDKFTMNYVGGLLRVGLLPGIPFRPAVAALSCERLDRTVESYVGPSRLLSALSRTYLRWIYFPLADHHIAVSEFVAGELREVAGGHKVDRGVWIGPMGVNARVFGQASREEGARKEILALTGAAEPATILVYAGRLAREKNIPLLFETLERLTADGADSFRLLLVGDGDARNELRKCAEATLPGLVCFAGHRPDAVSLASLLCACDIFVHPNPFEPFGIAPLEAMAAGLPLVAPDSGGVLSYASNRNAWLAPPRADAFASAIREILSGDDERARRTEAARQTAMSCDWPAAASRYLDLYAEIHRRVALSESAPEPSVRVEPAFFSTR